MRKTDVCWVVVVAAVCCVSMLAVETPAGQAVAGRGSTAVVSAGQVAGPLPHVNVSAEGEAPGPAELASDARGDMAAFWEDEIVASQRFPFRTPSSPISPPGVPGAKRGPWRGSMERGWKESAPQSIHGEVRSQRSGRNFCPGTAATLRSATRPSVPLSPRRAASAGCSRRYFRMSGREIQGSAGGGGRSRRRRRRVGRSAWQRGLRRPARHAAGWQPTVARTGAYIQPAARQHLLRRTRPRRRTCGAAVSQSTPPGRPLWPGKRRRP